MSDKTSEKEKQENVGFISFETETRSAGKRRRAASRKYILRGVVVFITVAILVGVAVACFLIVQDANKAPPIPWGDPSKPGKSCLHLLNNGIDGNGNYFIKIGNASFEVYCEMYEAGGGWTLVANVHQFDDISQCTNQNMWYGNSTSEMSRNWENKNTFGTLSNATSSDYKNPAYFSLQASNVMIRHLPNNYSVIQSYVYGSLAYHTTNNFLNTSGGNLYQAFKQYPLTPTSKEDQLVGDNPSILQQMLDALEAKGSDILNVDIPPLYEYLYDDLNPDRLTNGGNDLFDPYGMKISITGPNCSIDRLSYGQTYSETKGYSNKKQAHIVLEVHKKWDVLEAWSHLKECGNLMSKKNYPFFALLHTNSQSTDQYLYTVDSKRPNGGRVINITLASSTVYNNDNIFVMFYQTHCDITDAIPSYCDVTFTAFSYLWNSSFAIRRLHGNGHKSTHKDAVYGYTMIARNPGKMDVDLPVAELLHRILKVLSNFPVIDIEAMMDALVENSNEIVNITQPPPYRYQYEDGNPDQDTLSGDLFNPYGMKITAYTPNGNEHSIEYGKSFSDDLTEISSRKSYPFFALMKLNNPSLHQAAAFMADGARSRIDRTETENLLSPFDSITVGNFSMQYYARCGYSFTYPSICDVIFTVFNEQDWKSQKLRFANETTKKGENVNGSDTRFYNVFYQSRYTNAILGYTLLSRRILTRLGALRLSTAEKLGKYAGSAFPKDTTACSV